MKTFKLKRDDTFAKACCFKADNVTPTDLTDVTIKSQVRTSIGLLVAELTVTKMDQIIQPGVFTVRAGDTAAWPIGNLEWDILYQWAAPDGALKTRTETMIIKTDRSVTRGAN